MFSELRNHHTRVASALLAALLAGGCASLPGGVNDASTVPAAQALPQMIQQLLDALPADRATWERYVSDDAVYVAEDGTVATKQELLDGFGPFPAGLSGSIKVKDPKITEFGDGAIVVFDAHEQQTVFDQQISVDYVSAQAWRREGGRWRMTFAQTNVRAKDPPPSPVSRARLQEYTGTYELGDWRYRIEFDGDVLKGGSPAGKLTPLIAVGDNVLVAQGDPLASLRIFLRGPTGRIDRMVQRRKFADLVWKRIDNGTQ